MGFLSALLGAFASPASQDAWADQTSADAIQVYVARHRGFPQPERMGRVRNTRQGDRGPRSKPQGGLWTASWDSDGSAWVRFLRSSFEDRSHLQGWLLKPNGARVYAINSVEDLRRLLGRYGRPSHPEFASIFDDDSSRMVIDFERAADEYDAIRLTESGLYDCAEKQWTPAGRPCAAVDAWDVPSTVWMRWKFETPRPITFRNTRRRR